MTRRIALLALAFALGRAEVIDRVVASVGLTAITQGAVRRHLDWEAFFENRTPEAGAAAERRAIERLIDRALLQRELQTMNVPPPPYSEIRQHIDELRESRKQDAASFRAALARLGRSEEELEDHVRWQLTVLRFIDLRFRPAVQVDDRTVEEYYRLQVVPELGLAAPAFEDARPALLRLLEERELNATLDRWLKQARSLVRVRVMAGGAR